MSCSTIQERLTELALGGALEAPERWPAEDREHLEGCASCQMHLRFLGELVAELGESQTPAPTPAVVAASLERALRALRAQARPRGLTRELVGSLGAALLALPLVVLHGWLVARGAAAVLAPVIPGPVLGWIAVFYFASLALVVGALYGSIPLVVASRRTRLEAA